VAYFDTVILDLDGTLLDERTNLDGAFLAAARSLYDLADIELDVRATATTAARIADKVWAGSPCPEVAARYGLYAHDGLSEEFPGPRPDLAPLRAWLPEFRRRTWTAVLEYARLPADPALAAAAGAEFVRARHTGRLRPLAGARELLASLAGRRLGIMTNGPADGQHRKAAASGLASEVGAVIASTEAGVGKPDPGIVTAVLDAIGSPRPCRAVVVGDSPGGDAQAALNCGFPAILLWRSSPAPADLHPWVRTVRDLWGVPDAIAALEAGTPGALSVPPHPAEVS
jgi:putative hydrolase of the HAD superfamily